LDKYRIAEADKYFDKVNSKEFGRLYQKISEDVYPILRRNPFFGPNIKKLKGKYKGVYRFRTGDYRLFYKIEKFELIVFMFDIESRQGAYK
jgi:mRNA interferase RelE/StbE